MSAKNQISINIPDAILAEVTAKLADIKNALAPYMQGLTKEERHDLPKMSNKSFSFVSKANEYCSRNPEFTPAFMDASDLHTDFKAVSALKPLNDLCEQICSDINDTMLLAGSEAYTASLMYYSNVKLAAKTGQSSARPIFEDLSERFHGQRRKVRSTESIEL